MRFTILTILIFVFSLSLFAGEPFDKNELFLDDASLLLKQDFSAKFAAQNGPAVPQASENLPAAKSRGKAFMLSLLIPGMGERYTGNSKKATIFFSTEVTLWLTYSGLITYRNWRKEDYKTYAASHAQVDLDGKSDSYFIDVGNYMSINDYNAAKLRDRNLPEIYQDVNANFWQWENETRRQKFDQLRIASDKANNNSMFVIGAILANHLVSAVDAIWEAHKINQYTNSMLDLDVQFGDGYLQPRVNVGLTARF